MGTKHCSRIDIASEKLVSPSSLLGDSTGQGDSRCKGISHPSESQPLWTATSGSQGWFKGRSRNQGECLNFWKIKSLLCLNPQLVATPTEGVEES